MKVQLPYLIITFSCSSSNTRTCVINTLALWFVGEQLSLISSIYEIHTSCYIVLRLLFQGASTAWTTLGGNLCRFYYIHYRSIKDSISQYRQISCYFYLFIVVLEDHRQGKISDLSSADTQFYNYWSSTKKKSLVVETMIESLQFIVHQCFILY